MKLSNSIALVTGANRGIGQAYVAALLERGASKIYVAARDTATLNDLLKTDRRLVPLPLDITDPDQVAAAASIANDVTLLVNNAGFAAFEGAISAPDMDDARREMEVNYFGTLSLTRAFAPVLAKSPESSVINMLSMLSLVSLPMAATYSASKAAAFAYAQSARGTRRTRHASRRRARGPDRDIDGRKVARATHDAARSRHRCAGRHRIRRERRSHRRRAVSRYSSRLPCRSERVAGKNVHAPSSIALRSTS
jgi:NADP-dependent 3-hydroxy acid dehydrogenase YdfG